MRMYLTRISTGFLLLLFTGQLWANDEVFLDKDTGLGVGIALVRFDTTFKFTDLESGYSIFFDAEGTLNLPEADSVPVFYGSYRFTPKHALGFSYFKVKRESDFINIEL